MGVEFRLLGNIEVWVDGREADVGHARCRCVLVALLADDNRPVPIEHLMDRVWGTSRPRRARDTLYGYVSQLRRMLAGTEVRLARQSGGYLLSIDPDMVDLHRFRRLVVLAGTRRREAEQLALLRAAVALWRGEAFAGLGTAWLADYRQRLAGERLSAELARYELELNAGGQTAVLSGLAALAAAHPFDERVAGQLMMALYRSGRQADALGIFHDMRKRLVAELGIDPGAELRHRYQQILRADQAVHAATTLAEQAAARQLPADIADFIGRDAELRYLHSLAEQDSAHPDTALTILVIEGMAGVGKTRLAVRFARQLLRRQLFSDAQLWADLRGFHPEQPPSEPATVLANLLRLVGVAAHEIPETLEIRATLYRDQLGRHKTLLLLDDAASEDQVRPLLPGSPDCLVVITTRHSLVGLDGAHVLPLGTFTDADSLDLLNRHIGPERVAAEPEAARHLTQLCGHLPLALALTARHLRRRPALRLGELVTHVDTGDDLPDLPIPHASEIHAVFGLSYRALPAEQRRLLRLLTVHPGPSIAAASVAALADIPEPVAQTALDNLVDEHLVTPEPALRYGLHDLVRRYLTDQARRHDPLADRHAALERLTRHYLVRAQHATLLIHPTEHRRVTRPLGAAPWRTPAEAVAWVENEYENLVATVHRAAESSGAGPSLAIRLVMALYRPLSNRKYFADRIAIHQFAVRAAGRLGDRAAEAQVLEDLGSLCWDVGRIAEAVRHTGRALALWTELDDPVGRAACLVELGNSLRQQGDYDKAIEYQRQGLAITVETGDRIGEASALNFLGLTFQGTGNFERAITHLSRSSQMYRDAGNRLGEAIALANCGWAHQRAGQPRQALDHHQRSLDTFHELQDLYNEAEQYWGMAQCCHALGDAHLARSHWRTGITMLREMHALDDTEATRLLAQDVPDIPEIIRFHT
jgi:DNA-binding SARP family transcriptional activator